MLNVKGRAARISQSSKAIHFLAFRTASRAMTAVVGRMIIVIVAARTWPRRLS